MFSKIRPLIFKLDPETAHGLAIKALKFNIVSQNKIKNNKSIQTEIFGKIIPNPIGIAAGFDKDAEVYNPLFKLGFGFVEVGTITPINQYGNPKPRIFRLEEDEALINRLGFNNSGSEKVRSRIISNSPKGFFGINIGPNKDTNNRLEDYLIGLRKFYNLADYLTINISSPNTENLRSFHNEDELNELLRLIEEEKKILKTKVPITVKISPDIQDENITIISDLLLEHNVKAIIISNTTDRNRENLSNINKLEKGGLSGKPLEKKSNELINKFYKILKNQIKIIGVGGVDSGQSAYQKIINGASLVQLYTGMIYRGPSIASKISEELINILDKEGVKNISDLVGRKN
jgi:dihydroorotate dehydrogenase